MRKSFSLFATALIGVALSASAVAAQPAVPQARIISALRESFPGVEIQRVGPSRLPGLYEVVTAGEVAYTNPDGSLLFSGHLIDTKTHEDLTRKRWDEINAVDFEKLPFDLAIKTVRGNGARKLAVFSDPSCPFCQKLEKELDDVTDVTIYTFLYPLESIHPGATEIAVKIWCSDDRGVVWRSWMLDREVPAAQTCEGNPVETLGELGAKLRINSTPTLFFPHGQRAAGVLEKEALEKRLTASTAKK